MGSFYIGVKLNTTCEKCNKNFEVKQLSEMKDDIEYTFLECPHCKERYHSYKTNPEIRESFDLIDKQKERVEVLRRVGKSIKKEQRKLYSLLKRHKKKMLRFNA